MLRLKAKFFLLCWLALWLLSSCSSVTIKPEKNYSHQAKRHLYKLNQWSLEGRLAITGNSEAWSVDINWQHTPGQEKMRLSGPLGQGATIVKISDDFVSIDRGDGQVQSADKPEEFVKQQLGIFVPIGSLRYWVVGLPEPSQNFVETTDGFTQSGWLITYNEMQWVKNQLMPRKLTVFNTAAKLKLVIDQWLLTDENEQ